MDLSEIDRNFGRNLRTARQSAELSQEDLATRVTELGYEVSQATVGKIERGDRKVSIGEAEAFARAIGRPLHELMQGRNELTANLVHERLIRLRDEFATALDAWQVGQQMAAILVSDLKDVSPLMNDLLEEAILESPEDVVLSIQRDHQAENAARDMRDDLDSPDRGSSETPRLLREGILARYYSKFGDTITKEPGGRGVTVMMGRGLDDGVGDGDN